MNEFISLAMWVPDLLKHEILGIPFHTLMSDALFVVSIGVWILY